MEHLLLSTIMFRLQTLIPGTSLSVASWGKGAFRAGPVALVTHAKFSEGIVLSFLQKDILRERGPGREIHPNRCVISLKPTLI